MSPLLTIEDRLILACARTDPEAVRVAELVRCGPDWRRIVRKAERWKLVPLVHTNVRQASAPVAVVERLRHLHHLDATYGLARRAILRAALTRCSEARVPVVVLGGAVLAALVYPAPALRTMGRIDLFVREDDRARADAALAGVGQVRLCHRIARLPVDGVWARARPAQIESIATLAESPEDLLLQLALDMALRRSEPRAAASVRTLCDVGETCRRYGRAIEWRHLVAHAATHDVAEPLYWALRLARDLVAAGVPSDVLTELQASCDARTDDDDFVAGVVRRSLLVEDDATGDVGSSAVAPAPAPSAGRTPSTARAGDVAVTYDNETTTDGVGSQLHRIYGLYALSRALGVKYVHTPLGRVDYQGFVPLLTGRSDPDFVIRYNAFFSLPSDEFDLASCERVRVHILTEGTVARYRQHAAATGRPVLLEAIHHYGYTDAHPEALETLRAVSPYRDHRASGPIRVCIHLRRGDNAVPGRTDGRRRLLPDSYYLRVCGAVLEALREHDVPFVVRLHSEVPRRRYTIHPDTPGLFFRLNEPATVDPSEYALDQFEALPNVEMVLDVDAREALDDFATADVLILSLSSLGYLGGLLNPHGIVVYAPWWHPALADWLVADEHGNLDAGQVSMRITDHVRRRSSERARRAPA